MRQTLCTRTMLYNDNNKISLRPRSQDASRVCLPGSQLLLAAPALGGSHIPLKISSFLLPLSPRHRVFKNPENPRGARRITAES